MPLKQMPIIITVLKYKEFRKPLSAFKCLVNNNSHQCHTVLVYYSETQSELDLNLHL